jgi:hypothetical protein
MELGKKVPITFRCSLVLTGCLLQDVVSKAYNHPLSLNTFGIHDLDYQFALGDTYLFRNNVVSSFRVSASRAMS